MRKPRRLVECRLMMPPIAAYDESAALGIQPERGAGRTPEHLRTNDIEIDSKIWF